MAVAPVGGSTLPDLGLFATSFTGVLGVLVIATAARSARLWSPPPPSTLPAIAAVACAAIAVVISHQAFDADLPPGFTVYLAAVLAACLWAAIAAPQSMHGKHREPYVGVGAAFVNAFGVLLAYRAVLLIIQLLIGTDGWLVESLSALGLLVGFWAVFAPPIVLFYGAWAAARGRSLRSGVRSALWAIAIMPLANFYTIDSSLMMGGEGYQSGSFERGDPLSFYTAALFVFYAPFAVYGAAVGARGTPQGAVMQTGSMTDDSDHEPSPAQFWEARYADTGRVWSGRANQTLVDVVTNLPVGRALDLGCGEGGDAIWLAQQGWQVTGVDISPTAIARAEAAADEAEVPAGRIRWHVHDLATWMGLNARAAGPADGPYDLVAASFLHSPVEIPRTDILRRAADLVAPGGHLLILSHAAFPPWSTHHGHEPHFLTPTEEVAALGLPEDEGHPHRRDPIPRRNRAEWGARHSRGCGRSPPPALDDWSTGEQPIDRRDAGTSATTSLCPPAELGATSSPPDGDADACR